MTPLPSAARHPIRRTTAATKMTEPIRESPLLRGCPPDPRLVEGVPAPRTAGGRTLVILKTRLRFELLADVVPPRQDLLHEHRELTGPVAVGDGDTVLATLIRHFAENPAVVRKRCAQVTAPAFPSM